jgi:hypothetical protein
MIDKTSEMAEKRRPVNLGKIRPNYAFAAAQLQSSQGIFIGHTLAEPQGIGQSGFVVFIIPDPAPAQCRPKGGVVNDDPGAETGPHIIASHNFLVSIYLQLAISVHAVL